MREGGREGGRKEGRKEGREGKKREGPLHTAGSWNANTMHAQSPN